MALSLIYAGPAPRFFATSVADCIVYGFGKVQATIEDIPFASVKEKLEKVSICIKKETPIPIDFVCRLKFHKDMFCNV